MEPTSPVLDEDFQVEEVVYGGNQPEYNPIPAIKLADGTVITRWVLSPREREMIGRGGDVFLVIMTGGRPLQPVLLDVAEPNYTSQKVLVEKVADILTDRKRKADAPHN